LNTGLTGCETVSLFRGSRGIFKGLLGMETFLQCYRFLVFLRVVASFFSLDTLSPGLGSNPVGDANEFMNIGRRGSKTV